MSADKVLLLSYSPEIALKGKNRSEFVGLLKDNVASSLNFLLGINIDFLIRLDYSRLVLEFSDSFWQNRSLVCRAVSVLRRVFGVSSVSIAYKTELNIEKIKRVSLYVFDSSFSSGSFKIDAHRSNKSFSFISPEINKSVASYILSKSKYKDRLFVNLSNPDFILSIEILSNAFILEKKFLAVGGLPSFIEGEMIFDLSKFSDGAFYDFLLSALLIMRRGVKLLFFVGNRKEDFAKFFDELALFNNSSGFDFVDSEFISSSNLLIVEPLNVANTNLSNKLSSFVFPLMTDKSFLNKMSNLFKGLGENLEC